MRFLAALFTTTLFIFVALSSTAQASVLDIQEIKTDKGITAWLVEDDSIPVISVQFAFRGAGSVNNDASQQGLARMLSNTLDEGAGNLNAKAFQKELRDLSISLSYSASRDHFSGSLKTLTKNKERAFELLKLSLTKPRFDQEAIERMRQANQSRIRSSLSNPQWMARRLVNDKAFEGHNYALNSGGTLSSLERISAKDLRAFHKKHLGLNNLVVAVTGDIDSDALQEVLDDVFGDLPEVEIKAQEDIALQNTASVYVYERDIPQSVIEILQPGLARDDEDYELAQIMNFVLGSSGFGSRLTEEIREKRGLTYGIYSYLFPMDHAHALAVGTSTGNSNVPEMLSVITQEFEKMRDAPITAQELEDAKAYLIGSLPLSLTSTDKVSGLMLSLQLDDLSIEYLDQRARKIQAASLEDIQRVSKRLLDPSKFLTIIVGKPEGVENVKTITSLPHVE